MSLSLARVALACLVLAAGGCAVLPARAPAAAGPTAPARTLRRTEGRPPLAVIVREGDPRGAVALAVATEGIAPEFGATVPVALAALVEGRLDRRASVVPSGAGFRVRGLATTEGDARALTQALLSVLLTPVTSNDLPAAKRKLAALAKRPLSDAALTDASSCASEVVAPAGTRGAATGADAEGPTIETLESWRRAAVGLGRVTMATVGGEALADGAAAALASGPAWPQGAATSAEGGPNASGAPREPRVYDATGDVAAGGARVTLATRTRTAEDAVRAANALGDAKGALAARLGGLDAPASLRAVTATAHARGGCLVVSFELAPHDLVVEAAARVATAIALARQEIVLELGADVARGADEAESIARRAGDPRDAADLAAWWALSTPDASVEGEPRISAAVGLGTGKDAASIRGAAGVEANPLVASRGEAIQTELDRAIVGWHEPVVEARTRVEKGQGEVWIALGSPCGTLAEMEGDAGLGAAFAVAAAERAAAALRASAGSAEPWAAADGVGVIAHGPSLPGESSESTARRLADAVARSFAAEPVDRTAVAHARARLLGEDGREEARALVTLAEAVAPGHPSWLAPMGPVDALGRSSDAAVAGRASALRAGPLRVAVLGNASASQTDAAVRAVDRWVARRPGQTRACPAATSATQARPATYAVDASPGGATEAWLALALPAGDPAARADAEWIAASLDGAGGLLEHALGAGLARSWSARVVGGARAPALVVRVDAPPGTLDAAVAQVRGLLDRLRQGSLGDADVTRAAALLADRELADSLDPSHRVLALWRSPETAPRTDASTTAAPPTLDALRAFAASTLRDDALIIVAVRPPRSPADRPQPAPKAS